jgi:uncharacterized protein YlbG (UPF0298 family)
VSVNNQDIGKLVSILDQPDFVKKIKKKVEVDTTTQLSEQSLAEEWDSEEDSRYEKYFQQ